MTVLNGPPNRRRRWRLPLIVSAALIAAGALVLPGSVASAQPTRYEAESEAAACGGSIDSNHSGYSGSGFCNGANEVGAALQVTVTAGSSGTASVGIRFANGTSTARPADLIVNGSTVRSVSFEATGSWSTWATKTVTVDSGSNTIRLNPTSSAGLPNVDYLDVEASAAPSRHEAESSSATCDGAIDSNWSGYSGTGFCNTSNAEGAAVQFTVNASESGTATLQVRFANGTSAARPADVIVNGSTVTTTSFESTGAWSTWATKTVAVTVNSGSNTIRLSATGSAGLPNVDYLDFTMGGETPPPPPPPPPADGPVGWASVEGGTTGGAGGETVTVTDGGRLAQLLEEDRPLVIRVQGMLTMPDKMNDVHSDKTILGVGSSSGLRGGGLNISSGYHNIIIRNLNFRDWADDGINIQNSAHHIWVDHNSFANGYDGAVDVKRGSDFVTVSWNHFFDHQKLMLLGHDDGNGGQDRGHLRVTYHHNWFDGTAERHPRVRFGNPVHVFNNYYDAVGVYGVASTTEAGVLVEGNYFESTATPCVRGYGDSPEPGGIVERNNHFVGSGTCASGGSVSPIPYSYRLDNASDVKSIVMAGAGPR